MLTPLSEKEARKLFFDLYNCKDEEEIEDTIVDYVEIFEKDNWKALGDNDSNFSIVKNQQSNPIAAVIEKVTNSIDALLTKHCLLNEVDPKSPEAPQSMNEAIDQFFPDHNWDLDTPRRMQAEEIQVIADGRGPRSEKRKSKYDTSVVVYDNGEGQHPEDFEDTFLSLIKGNKNNIHFVQGKYNMGGSGAIVFCGKKRYQLIASKRYDRTGKFGFTLIREHPLKEEDQAKETWYEYLIPGGKIPAFEIDLLDLGLKGRKFKTGSVIKMYSYQLPQPGYSAFSQDLNQSINEYLFKPVLPILTADTAERYPKNKVLETSLFGLNRRLLKEESEYLDERFSLDFNEERFGKIKVSCFVFKTKVKDNDLSESRKIIQRRYFKNDMRVLFSLNGQVHGHLGSEFITRSLKLNLLKSHLLIHVDCTEIKYEFRKELFMASRDRLKRGSETHELRTFLARQLSRKDGRLSQIEKRRKQAADIDTSASTKELIKNFTKSLPMDAEIMKLLGETFKLDLKKDKPDKKKKAKKKQRAVEEETFNPQRFPSKFRIDGNKGGKTEVAKIPIGSGKTILFETDVEDDYFDRSDEPGELKIALLKLRKHNEGSGGDEQGEPTEVSEVLNVRKSSPNQGKIKLHLTPQKEAEVGDAVEMKVTLTSPNGDLDEIFMVKIAEPKKKKEKKPKEDADQEPLGLPDLVFAYEEVEEGQEGAVTWEAVEEATTLAMNHGTCMSAMVKDDALIKVYVNMESQTLRNYKSKQNNPNADQIELTNRKYYTSVYFHTLFLYTITKNRGYEIYQKKEGREETDPVDVGSYLKDVFDNYYSTFILNFGGMEAMMQGLGE